MNKKAFTLIELLAVITILAIVALIAVPSVTKMIKDSNESADENQKKLIAKAAESWANATGLNLCDATESNKAKNCYCTSGTNEEKIFCIKKDDSKTKTTEELIKEGYLDSVSDEYKNSSVVITRSGGKYKYEFKANNAPSTTCTYTISGTCYSSRSNASSTNICSWYNCCGNGYTNGTCSCTGYGCNGDSTRYQYNDKLYSCSSGTLSGSYCYYN